ncbi:tRNA pseudouridine synthase A [Nitrospira sp.]|nr:tRNA pseudouridine synthase A [Nitrospira sp.]
MAVATFKLTVEYDGSEFAGWQRQADQPTIQAALEQALLRMSQHPTPLVGAGRTDAGVHALGQVASFRSDKSFTPEEWRRGLNALVPESICVRTVERVADDFHARYSAKGKLYEYRLLNREERTALDRTRMWHLQRPLDVTLMQEAAQFLLGRHDCSSFQGPQSDVDNRVCDIREVTVRRNDDIFSITIYADRFLKQMVRAIVGTLVEVGLRKRSPTSMNEILAARDRCLAGRTAPAHGLYLVRVDY